MAETFDPYHKWLGISPKDQPPHYYRLLGIEPFENDPDVIDHAADRQMAHVRGLQSGQHSAATQKLLGELAAARLCLLTPEKKAAYDAQLRPRLATVQPISAPPPSPAAVPVPRPPTMQPTTLAVRPAHAIQPARPVKRRTSRSSLMPLWLAGLAGIAVLLAAGFLYRSFAPPSPKPTADRPVNARGKHATPAQTPAVVSPPKQREPSPKPEGKSAPAPARETWISQQATYTLSSTGDGVVALPSLLTGDDPEREYAFHTQGGEAGAHIVIDLGDVKQVTRLEIVNRRDPALYSRAKGMQLWLAVPRPSDGGRFPLPPDFGREVWTAAEGLPVYQVQLPQPTSARYLKLGFPPERIEFLNLAKVRVYGYE